MYEISTTCPVLWDVLGFPGSFPYLPEGTEVYFNRTDVQKAINAPIMEWEECSSDDVFVGGHDTSDPSTWSVLPRAIEKNERTIIGHGILDFILMTNGSLYDPRIVHYLVIVLTNLLQVGNPKHDMGRPTRLSEASSRAICCSVRESRHNGSSSYGT